jgi:phage protein D
MIIRHPVARLTAGSRTLTSAEGGVALVDARLSSGGEHDAVRVVLWSTSKLAGIAPGDPLSLAMGEAGDEVDVWAGEVTRAEAREGHVIIDGLALTAALSRERRSQSWEDQAVEDIVRDLAGAVAIDEVDASLRLPWYAVDVQRSVWSHLRELAGVIGAELGASASGAVRFVPVAARGSSHTLRRGAELVRWQLAGHALPDARGARAYAAASESGAAQWHWLRGDSGGAGGSVATLGGALRTRDAAEAVATARSQRRTRREQQGVLVTCGSPEVRPGDAVTISGVSGAPADTWRVRAARHRLDGTRGLSTTLHVEGAGR